LETTIIINKVNIVAKLQHKITHVVIAMMIPIIIWSGRRNLY